MGTNDLEAFLSAVGEVLGQAGQTARLIVVGGAALMLGRLSDRLTTVDVDVLAEICGGEIVHPDPFSAPLAEAVREVADGYGLDADWMNGHVAQFWRWQWPDGLPQALLTDVQWHAYGALEVGLAGRQTLIALKLRAVATQVRYERVAAADGSLSTCGAWIPETPDVQRHLKDLLGLAPTEDELGGAIPWVWTNANTPDFSFAVDAVTCHVRDARR